MKKAIIIITSAAVAVGGVFGAYQLNERRKTNKAVAKVTPVSLMVDSYYGSDLELSGMISSGNVQNIMPDNQKLVEEVLVKEGDSVKKGDPILKYDITALELDLKAKENAVAVAESDIKTANKELKKLKNLKPSESMPEPPAPTEPPEPPTEPPAEPTNPQVEIKNVIGSTADSASGSGTDTDPLIFNCNTQTIIKAELFTALKANGSFAVFTAYSDDFSRLYQWQVSGTEIKDEQLADKAVGENVSVSADGNITVKWSDGMFGSYTMLKAEESESIYDDTPAYDDAQEEAYDYTSEEDFYNSIPRNYPEDYEYSRAELAKMISEKETEIQKLEIDKKSADLEYKIAQEQKESGSITARLDGIVSKVNDPESLEAGEPYIIIQGNGGLTVRGYIGELNLDRISVGTFINVMLWETGESAQAEVTEISDIPISYDSQNWGENPNSSTYEFTASVTDDITISADTGISITLPSQDTSDSIYIPKVYVRDEDGRSYVYRADEKNRLEKLYIKTGKTVYGSEIEIKSGLSEDDRICFPYGKNIREGIRTEDSDEVLW